MLSLEQLHDFRGVISEADIARRRGADDEVGGIVHVGSFISGWCRAGSERDRRCGWRVARVIPRYTRRRVLTVGGQEGSSFIAPDVNSSKETISAPSRLVEVVARDVKL